MADIASLPVHYIGAWGMGSPTVAGPPDTISFAMPDSVFNWCRAVLRFQYTGRGKMAIPATAAPL